MFAVRKNEFLTPCEGWLTDYLRKYAQYRNEIPVSDVKTTSFTLFPNTSKSI